MTKRVIIIGGGFAGLSTAVHLSRHLKNSDDVDILLIDKQSEHVYLPLIYEVASGGLVDETMAGELKKGVSFPFDLSGKLTDYDNVRFRQGEVLSVDIEQDIVHLATGANIKFDYLVIAMGAQSNTFGVDGVEKNAISLLTLDDALAIRKKVAGLMSDCSRKLRSTVDIVIVGGGPSGVEMACEMAVALEKSKGKKGVQCNWSITLVDASLRILSNVSKWHCAVAQKRLKKLGVKIASATFVKSVKPATVMLTPDPNNPGVSPFSKQTRIKSDLTIWSAGVCARPIWAEWGLPVDARGYIKALPTLQVFGTNHVFTAGDATAIIGRKMQQRAPEAVDQGQSLAENLIRVIRGQAILRAHHEKKWPFAIPLGGMNAISSFGRMAVFGIFGYAILKLIDLRYFLSIMHVTTALKTWWQGSKTYTEND